MRDASDAVNEVAGLDLGRMALQSVRCPICDGASFETLATRDRYGMGLCTVGCKFCGLILTNPQPTAAAISDFYAHAYRRFYQSVDRPTLDYIVSFGKDARAEVECSHLLGWVEASTVRTIADVGCAEGSLLKALGTRVPGAQLSGVEVDDAFADFARAYTGATIVSSVEALPPGYFDLVVLNHVFEHIREPEPYLRAVGALLRPQGLLYVAVPDAASYKSLADLHIAHLFHYTPVSLERLLRRSGYAVVRQGITTPPNHPTTIAVLARADSTRPARPPDLDTTGWRNVRRANRYAPFYSLRRIAAVRSMMSKLKRMVGS